MSTGTSAPKLPNYPARFPTVSTPQFPAPQGLLPIGDAQQQPDYSNFDFSSLDLPQWGGAYSAPLTQQQIDSMRGFDVLSRNNPLAQTLNQMFTAGGNIQDLGNAFRPYGTGYGTLEGIAGSSGQQPNFTGTDTGAAQGLINQAAGAALPQADLTPVTGFVGDVLHGMPGSDRTQSNNFLSSLFGAGGVTGGTADLTNLLTSQLGQSFNQSFDQTPTFRNAEQLFTSDLDRQLAKIREEYSGLGLGPGSSDRADMLGRTAGDALAQFRLGQEGIAQGAFENTQNRNLQAIATGQSLAPLTQLPIDQLMSALPALMQNEGMPLNERLAIQGQQIGSLPTLLQALTTNPQLQQQGSGLLAQLAGTQAGLSQVPFQEQMSGFANLYQNLINPQASRSLEAGSTLLGADQNAIAQSIQALLAQGGLLGQDYSMGEQARGIADTDIQRAIASFMQGQGGTLNQALGVMGGIPGMNTGFGPSGLSQLGGTLTGIAGLGTGIMDLINALNKR